LLLQGDTSKDAQLKSGDVVFIPPIGLTVGIRGEVRRPAIYEIKQDTSAEQLISFAGGMLSTAHPKLSKVQRLSRDDQKLLLDVDLAQAGSNFKLKNGDDVYIPASLEILNNVVTVSGEVLRPGMQHWQPGVRISDMINAAGLRPNADLNYALIKRYLPPSGKLQIQSFSLSEILTQPGSEKDLMLLDQDELILFDLYQSERKAVITALVDELRVHTGIHSASQEVVVSGNVRYPGTYPLVEGMQIEDLINAAGGLTEKAFQLRAELSRTEFNEQQERYQYRVDLNLSAADSLNFALKSRDELQVKTIPDWAESEQVVLTGEVKFPGTYPIYRDDTLASLLERAGGVTELAYAPGAIFTRTDLKKQQAEQLIAMQERLAEDIAKAELVVSNQGGDKKDAGEVAEAQKLLSQLKSTSATGRLVIDLDKVLANDLNYSIPLQEGDTLYVPGKKNSVTIVGEVQLPISQIYESQLDYWDYIERSGGTTEKADEDRVYIIKANGGVQIPNGSSWFTSNQQQQIAPGDTIVVPLDADRLNQTLLWRDVSQIFYQIALGAAAVGSL
jgi:protein involved in polysaccharide export with SLBB domain